MSIQNSLTSFNSRAQGAWMGQLCGDSLGSLVEFKNPDEIRKEYPHGVRDMSHLGVWKTLPGQPTDDSEMALALARSIIARSGYESTHVLKSYKDWLASDPFDCGGTVHKALVGISSPDSQANGAMMRASPIGIFGANLPLAQVALLAKEDAALTHVNAIVGEANALFAMAIASAIARGPTARELYENIRGWANDLSVHPSLISVIENSAIEKPNDYVTKMGWVMIAFQNALWQLLHAKNFEEAIVDTVAQGGDTDTTAAICGALLGAVHGIDAVPKRWQSCVLSCRPIASMKDVKRARPEKYWPIDALVLPLQLLEVGKLLTAA